MRVSLEDLRQAIARNPGVAASAEAFIRQVFNQVNEALNAGDVDQAKKAIAEFEPEIGNFARAIAEGTPGQQGPASRPVGEGGATADTDQANRRERQGVGAQDVGRMPAGVETDNQGATDRQNRNQRAAQQPQGQQQQEGESRNR